MGGALGRRRRDRLRASNSIAANDFLGSEKFVCSFGILDRDIWRDPVLTMGDVGLSSAGFALCERTR